jgi:hypothetical protein
VRLCLSAAQFDDTIHFSGENYDVQLCPYHYINFGIDGPSITGPWVKQYVLFERLPARPAFTPPTQGA